MTGEKPTRTGSDVLIHAGVLLTSFAVLGLELALMRTLSISHWHHFAAMIISVALLGFGVSGTFLTLFRRRLLARPRESLAAFALALAAFVPLSFQIAQQVRFNPLELGYGSQYVQLVKIYALYLVPFFLGGCVIGLALSEPGAKVASRYAANLFGTGLGAAGIILLMYVTDLSGVLWVVTGAAALAAALFACAARSRVVMFLTALGFVSLAVAAATFHFEPTISDFTRLSFFRDLIAQDQAEVVAQRWGPLGRLDVIDSPAIHEAPPDASIDAGRTLPPQRLILVDADGGLTVDRTGGDLSRVAYLDDTTSALAYHLLKKARVALVGAGGGEPLLLARLHEAASVTGIEPDRNVIDLMRGPLAEFSDGIYDAPGVHIVCTEGRAFFETTDERFDLVVVPVTESFSPEAAGAHALNESYRYTVEAVTTYLDHLEEGGILSMTCGLHLRSAPFEAQGFTFTRAEGTVGVRLLSTVAAALRQTRWDPAPHVVAVRTALAMTVLVKNEAFGPDEIARVREFAERRGFALVYHPGIGREDANRNAVLPSPVYYDAAQRVLLGRGASAGSFDTTPVTDDRPYFFDFFRWEMLGPMLESGTSDWLLVVDWGYLALVVTLVQAATLSAVLILVPLFFVRRRQRDAPTSPGPHAARVLAYFLCLGLAFMFLEMTYIQRMVRFLWHPVLSAAVVVTGFLVFAGAGSAVSGVVRMRERSKVLVAVVGICAAAVLEHVLMPTVFSGVQRASFGVRAGVVLCAIAPLAFFMGVPFPTALQSLARTRRHLVPWAWGVNGFASVVATVLATMLSMTWGFGGVTWLALGCYASAGLLSMGLFPREWSDERETSGG